MFPTITLTTEVGSSYVLATCWDERCGWRMSFSTTRMDDIVKTVLEHAHRGLVPYQDVSYSRGMTETGNNIQAQASAVKALADAFDREVQTNGIANLHQARAFIATWAAAVAALAPDPAAKIGMTEVPNADTGWDGETEPEIGRTVMDKDGDPWTRVENGRWICRYDPRNSTAMTGDVWEWVKGYGPFTLVQES